MEVGFFEFNTHFVWPYEYSKWKRTQKSEASMHWQQAPNNKFVSILREWTNSALAASLTTASAGSSCSPSLTHQTSSALPSAGDSSWRGQIANTADSAATTSTPPPSAAGTVSPAVCCDMAGSAAPTASTAGAKPLSLQAFAYEASRAVWIARSSCQLFQQHH